MNSFSKEWSKVQDAQYWMVWGRSTMVRHCYQKYWGSWFNSKYYIYYAKTRQLIENICTGRGDRMQESLRNKSSVWLNKIYLRTRKNKFEIFVLNFDTWKEHWKLSVQVKYCCSEWISVFEGKTCIYRIKEEIIAQNLVILILWWLWSS